MAPRQIASDLDGTLIPPAADAAHDHAVLVLARAAAAGDIELTYVTGRHLSLALHGVARAGLPIPHRLFADVGTSLYHRVSGARFERDEAFRDAMRLAFGALSPDGIGETLSSVPGLFRQPDDRQAEFKLSFETAAERLGEVLVAMRERLGTQASDLSIVTSHDPVTGHGLVDVLPRQAGKARALAWLVSSLGVDQTSILFAGDSGNDRAALLSGHPAVLVGNAPDALRADLSASAVRAGVADRLYCARASYAAGVVEGAEYFEFI